MVERITGLSGSGLDTDALVKSLMNAHRVPVDRLAQKRQVFEWQRDDYREMNLKLTDFRANKLTAFKLEGTFGAKKVVVGGNGEALTARATANALTGTLNVEVDSLASAATNRSFNTIDLDNTFDSSATLTSQVAKLRGGTFSQANYKFTINNIEIEVNPATDSLNDVIQRINKNTTVSAFFDGTTGNLALQSKGTGVVNFNTSNVKQAHIDSVDTSGNFLSNFMFIEEARSAVAVGGTAASVIINGLTTTRDSNTFQLNGVEVTLRAAGGAASIISSAADTDKVVESIKTFIKDYNDLLKAVQDKIGQTKHKDFQPLTDAQRDSLSDKQIEKWEEKAKSGLIRSDPLLTKAVNDMRTAVNSRVETGFANYQTLSSLGIESGDYSENGKLYLTNETKLKAALEDNPDAIKALFTGDAQDGGTGTEVGIAERVYANLNKVLTDLTKKAGNASALFDNSTISSQILGLSIQMDTSNRRLTELETNYFKRFSAMESAINRLNSQSVNLANAFAK